MKEKIQNEKKLRNDANNTLEQLNKKVRELDSKYQKELMYYKELALKKEDEVGKVKDKLQRAIEKVLLLCNKADMRIIGEL